MKAENFEINEYIKEYLAYNVYDNSLECFEAEIRTKQVSAKLVTKQQNKQPTIRTNLPYPRIYGMMKGEQVKGRREEHLEKDFNEMNRRFTQILAASKQIFSVAVGALQLISDAGLPSQNTKYADSFEHFKVQIGKYNKIILNEGKAEAAGLMQPDEVKNFKDRIAATTHDGHPDAIVDVLLDARVRAMQTEQKLRRDLVRQFVMSDIFGIQQNGHFDLVLSILNIESGPVRHAATAFLSIIASTFEGINYLTLNNKFDVVAQVIKVVKLQDNGSVTQRFCLAILQKLSLKDEVTPTLIDQDMLYWTIALLDKASVKQIHPFCLDFCSALLANMINTDSTITMLEQKVDVSSQVLEGLLRLLKSKMPVSVYSNLLIAISFFAKPAFEVVAEPTRLADRVNEFVAHFSQMPIDEVNLTEKEKKNILNLCAEMFTPPEGQNGQNAQNKSQDKNESVNKSDISKRIHTHENADGDLIFECFQDEVSK